MMEEERNMNEIMETGAGQADFDYAQQVVRRLREYFSAVVVGQEELARSLVCGVLADGHILIESVPGLAKTTAARTIADAVNGKFSRIQCRRPAVLRRSSGPSSRISCCWMR